MVPRDVANVTEQAAALMCFQSCPRCRKFPGPQQPRCHTTGYDDDFPHAQGAEALQAELIIKYKTSDKK